MRISSSSSYGSLHMFASTRHTSTVLSRTSEPSESSRILKLSLFFSFGIQGKILGFESPTANTNFVTVALVANETSFFFSCRQVSCVDCFVLPVVPVHAHFKWHINFNVSSKLLNPLLIVNNSRSEFCTLSFDTGYSNWLQISVLVSLCTLNKYHFEFTQVLHHCKLSFSVEISYSKNPPRQYLNGEP